MKHRFSVAFIPSLWLTGSISCATEHQLLSDKAKTQEYWSILKECIQKHPHLAWDRESQTFGGLCYDNYLRVAKIRGQWYIRQESLDLKRREEARKRVRSVVGPVKARIIDNKDLRTAIDHLKTLTSEKKTDEIKTQERFIVYLASTVMIHSLSAYLREESERDGYHSSGLF